MADKPLLPIPPSQVKVGGDDESNEMPTKAMDHVTVSAVIDHQDASKAVALKIEYTSNDWNTSKSLRTEFGKQARRDSLVLPNLKVNTLYKAKLWTVDKVGHLSKQFTTISFWTNRPAVIKLVTPAENSEFNENQTIPFDWEFNDPDDSDETQHGYRIRYRTADGEWTYVPRHGPQEGALGKNTYYNLGPDDDTGLLPLVANTTYYWSVKARDPQGIWSDWALAQSFYVRGLSTPPKLVSPKGGIGGAAVVVGGDPVTFSWQFKDPDPANKQVQADIRWRVVDTGGVGGVGDPGWFVQVGQGTVPGSTMQWSIASGYFSPGFLYEWQVRTYDDTRGIPSGWSESGKFMATLVPGSMNLDPPLAEETDPLGALGCGHHRVFVYDRGGRVLRGEIKPIARLLWTRRRDDISNCIIDTNGFDQDCGVLLGDTRSWVNELVVYRDGIRVWEGPITRITYTSTSVEIEAKDVMQYLYRRVMRQGYNDRYRRIDLTPNTPAQPIPPSGKPAKGGPYVIVGQNTVVDRALQTTLNALAYRDPNVLPYVTAIRYGDDALEQRSVVDYGKTAWEDIDDLAATAGLDYTVIGRRILYWDTNRAIGRLPEMRDGDFSDPVIVTEYGMDTANWYAVSNNNGVAGVAYPSGLTADNWFSGKAVSPASPVDGRVGHAYDYGPVEMVSSAYGEQEASTVSTEALTPAERDKLVQTLKGQAKRGIAHRWPTPVVVRVPDNSSINPQVNLGINQLIPGVWIPLRATLTCRKLAQWQKLDSLDVEEVEGTEAVRVTMSPAPHGGNDDPDKGGTGEADAS